MNEFFRVIPWEEGKNLVAQVISPRSETVWLSEAVGRILAEDIYSGEDLPSFSRSSVDGYAVKAEDTYGASESLPAFLTLKGSVFMGETPSLAIMGMDCLYIPTGGMMPAGADAVVMIEHTELLDQDTVLVSRPVASGENVIYQGEDVKKGEIVYKKGTCLRPQDVGVLAALGINEVSVNKRLRVGIISTGDEVVPPQCKPAPGQIRDVNGYALYSGVLTKGGIPRYYGIIPDQAERLDEVLRQAVEENDLVLLSGGSSVGVKDLSLQTVLSLPRAELLFHGLAVKPGKPTLALRVDERLVVGLPGHPVSAYMIFATMIAPLLSSNKRPRVKAVLASNLPSAAGRDDLVRVRLEDKEGRLLAAPVWGKSGLIRVMAAADGYVHIPSSVQGLASGEEVVVNLFD